MGVEIATDRDGNGYVTGRFTGVAIFGPSEANQTMLSSAGFTDIFVAKYAPGGKLLSVRSAGGLDADGSSGVATDRRGDIYVTGGFTGTATFGASQKGETVLDATGGDFDGDLFVAKYLAEPPRRPKDRSVLAAMD